jgi:hypothetical protein
MIGIQFSDGNDVLGLGNDESGGGSGCLIEIVFSHSIDEVSCRVGLPRANERDVCLQGGLEQALLPVDDSGLPPFCKRSAGGRRREEPAQPRTAGANRLGQRALRPPPSPGSPTLLPM